MKKIFFFALVSSSLFLVSCRSENEEELFKNIIQLQTCDTIAVNYTDHIKPLFESQCVSCHTGDAVFGCNLDNYENTRSYIISSNPNQKLYDYVKNNDHQGVVLDSCSLKQFAKWIINPAP